MYFIILPFLAIFLPIVFYSSMVLSVTWFKNYDEKCKYFNFFFFVILYEKTLLRLCNFAFGVKTFVQIKI